MIKPGNLKKLVPTGSTANTLYKTIEKTFVNARKLLYQDEVRPHQALGNRPLTGEWSEINKPLKDGEQIVCRERLGGLLQHYERIAARVTSLNRKPKPITVFWCASEHSLFEAVDWMAIISLRGTTSRD